jgi:Tol biopolymer transport system component
LFFLDSPDAKIRGTYHSTLDRAERTKLTDVRTTFAPPDQLLLHFREGLQAQHLNVDTMQLTGEPRLLSYEAQAALSTSDNGVLIYRPLQSSGNYQMELVDRSAKRLSIVGKPGDLFMPRLSPDGRKVAVERHNDNAFGDIEIIDLSRDAVTRFTFNPTQHNAAASWSPSGDRLAFHTTGVQSGRGDAAASAPGLFVKPANGLAPEQLILESASPTDWTPSDVLVVERTSPNAGRRGSYDLWQVPLSGKREPSPLLNSPASEIHGRVSPNGRWLAYVSDEAGEREVYVTQFPPAGGKWQLSTGGGTTPVWRKDGSELFYLSLDGTLMAVPVRTERVFEHDTAIPLFKWAVRQLTANFWFYDAAQDGQQFIGVVPAGDRTRTELNVIVNWQR